MNRAVGQAAMTMLAVFLWTQPGPAQPADDLKTLRKDVESLKDGLTAIQRDLQEIKRLLQARPPTAQAVPAPPQNVVLNLDGAPIKGVRGAKVTLVEFTDYQ